MRRQNIKFENGFCHKKWAEAHFLWQKPKKNEISNWYFAHPNRGTAKYQNGYAQKKLKEKPLDFPIGEIKETNGYLLEFIIYNKS